MHYPYCTCVQSSIYNSFNRKGEHKGKLWPYTHIVKSCQKLISFVHNVTRMKQIINLNMQFAILVTEHRVIKIRVSTINYQIIRQFGNKKTRIKFLS